MMSTESDRSGENRHQEPGFAEEPQRAETSGGVWPDRLVPPWSVPPGLITSQATRPEADVGPLDVEPPDAEPVEAEADDDWPGAAPPAGWFLRSSANGSAVSQPQAGLAADPEIGDADENVTGEWFASAAPVPGESPVSWHEGMDDPAPDAEPPASATPEPGEPAASAPAAPASAQAPAPSAAPAPAAAAGGGNVTGGGNAASNGNGSAPAGIGPSRRFILAAEPVVSPTRALRGRPGGTDQGGTTRSGQTPPEVSARCGSSANPGSW